MFDLFSLFIAIIRCLFQKHVHTERRIFVTHFLNFKNGKNYPVGSEAKQRIYESNSSMFLFVPVVF